MSYMHKREMRMIINGKSAGDPRLRSAVAEIREQGYLLEIRVTWEAGDAARYAAEAVHDKMDVVIAAGGDGTVNEVVGGVMKESETPDIALGVVPYGTANDFASGCGIPCGNPLAALSLITERDPRPIDVGKVNDHYFINVTSGGFGAVVTASTPPQMKQALGGAAYSLMGVVTLAKMTPWHARVVAAERQEEGDMIIMAVGNGRQCGGGYQVTPNALLDDGLLDLMVVHDIELANLGTVLAEVANIGSPENRYVSYVQLPSFTIELDEPFQVNLDGEPLLMKSYHFEALPKALKCILPKEAPLKK